MKKINSLYNGKVFIDESTRKLVSYDNAKKRAVYSAKIVENGETTIFGADFIENEIVTDVEARLRAFGSPVNIFYAKLVNFNSDKYDPDNKIWNIIVDYVKSHENEFFFKNGNLRKRIQITKKLFKRV